MWAPIKAMLLLSVTSVALASCRGENDYGWPRFKSREELEADGKWSYYFQKVYGGLPDHYPVCVYDMWFIHKEVYQAAGLGDSRPLILNQSVVQEGDLFVQLDLASTDYGIYHSQWEPAPANSWLEVTHTILPTEETGAWAWTSPGSGVWYNIGRTIVFPQPADPRKTHQEAIQFLSEGCSVDISTKWPLMESQIFGLCAREKGYDSIQFEPQEGQHPLGSFGLTGKVELVLVNVDGDKTCGVQQPSQTPLRAGWNASRLCECVEQPIDPSCGLMPTPPFPYNITGESPPLCGDRANDKTAICNSRTCTTYQPLTC